MKSKKLFNRVGFFLFLTIIGAVGSSIIVGNVSAEKIITIATLEYHPWTGKNLKFNGFVNHVITEAFRRGGYTVKYAYLPWKRAVGETKRGDYAALSYTYFSKDREKEFYLSDPISAEKIVLFHLKTNPIKDWKNLDDLKIYKIGATRGYTYTKEFWKSTVPSLSITQVGSGRKLIICPRRCSEFLMISSAFFCSVRSMPIHRISERRFSSS